MEEEEQEKKKQKQKMEEDEEPERKTEEEAEEAKRVNAHDEKDGGRREEEHSEMKDCGTLRRRTSYYCKTCSGEPSLCPVPCFELYHTRLIYKTAPELETQGEPSE